MKKNPLIMVLLTLILAVPPSIVNAEEKVKEKLPEKAAAVAEAAATDPAKAEITKDMVLVPAGDFIMGVSEADVLKVLSAVNGMAKYLDNAGPSRKVNLPAFYIDKYEVTNEQYKKFIDATGRKAPEGWEGKDFPAGKGKHPVVYVTWFDAEAYAKWAGKRLPTEAEWEKAARGTDGRLYPWGDKFDKRSANTTESNRGESSAVGDFKKGQSPYGAFDMAGNVWEWTSDFYLPYPDSKCQDEFFGKERYVLRGGSWDDEAYDALTFVRSKFTPQTDDENVGFRCAY